MLFLDFFNILDLVIVLFQLLFDDFLVLLEFLVELRQVVDFALKLLYEPTLTGLSDCQFFDELVEHEVLALVVFEDAFDVQQALVV